MEIEDRKDGIAFLCKDKEEMEILSDNYQELQKAFKRMVDEASQK